jgi:hypothetical protein
MKARTQRDGEAGRVLVVDDAWVRLVCAVDLEPEGLRVIETADGLHALEQAPLQVTFQGCEVGSLGSEQRPRP